MSGLRHEFENASLAGVELDCKVADVTMWHDAQANFHDVHVIGLIRNNEIAESPSLNEAQHDVFRIESNSSY